MNEYFEKKLFDLIEKGKFNDKKCFEWQGPYDKDGYGITTLTEDKKKKTWKIHRLIFYILRGEISQSTLVCHACDNPKCFNINHLFLGTYKDNSQDRENKGRGRSQNGEDNFSCKLTQLIVLQIRKKYSEGSKVKDLVKEFNVTQPTISKIVLRKRWQHI